MSDLLDRISKLSPKRLALLALELQDRVDALEAQRREPIAVVGMACRLPGGANSPEAYWQLLRDGVDAVSEVPADRWDWTAYFDPDQDAPGKMVTRWGGFIDDIDRFDAALFGISPREATSLDPQQRLLLETSWAAFEDAGHAPDGLRGSRTGVFVGIGTNDYALLMSQATSLQQIDAYRATGCISHSPAAGRISYVLGLQGPALAVDTACSSSLVAVHLACQALRSDECRMALAGGVNAILLPELGVSLSKAGMMARDGRCKTFDARADGFVRGEGCGVVVLKRLSHALEDGNRVLAIIRGTASNQDGRSNGLTAPNGPAQEEVIREAVARSGIQPGDVSYVETHGTGTELGDPIEVRALGAVLCQGRPADEPLRLGSVKTNIGHLEATAGVASLIKLVLALEHKAIPASLHFETPNPHIPWHEFPLEVTSRHTEWVPASGRRIGGVSAFGFSGTNAHVIVEEAPAGAASGVAPVVPGGPVGAPEARDAWVLTLSGKTAGALAAVAGRYAAWLRAHPEVALGDVCFTANVGRAALGHRAAVVTRSRAELVAQLEAVAAGRPAAGVVTGEVRGAARPRVAALCTGQGAQYAGMGAALYASAPVFRAAVDACAAGLAGELAVPLVDVLYGATGARLDETAYAQPALFAVEYALAQLWASWGVTPGAVLGHSVGEYAAAVVAGVLPLAAALRLVAARGRLLQGLPAGGTMAAVLAPVDVVTAAVAGTAVEIAAENAPAAQVIAGPAGDVAAVTARLVAQGVEVQPLQVSHAFHTALVEPMLEAWEAAVRAVPWGAPTAATVVSGLTGEVASAAALQRPEYWRRQVRERVRFAAGVRTLVGLGYEACVELGPQPTLTTLAQRTVPDAAVTWGGALRRGQSDWASVLTGAAGLWVRGVALDWAAVEAGVPRRRVALPTYPFQRTRFWVESAATSRQVHASSTTTTPAAADAEPMPSAPDALAAIAPHVSHLTWDAVGDRLPSRMPSQTLPSARAVVDALAPEARALDARHATAAFDAVEPEVDALCGAYVYHALRALGWTAEPGTTFSTGELAGRLGVTVRHRRLLGRLLDMLQEDGVLDRRGSLWHVRAHAAPDEPRASVDAFIALHPAWSPELSVLARCGAALGDVLSGARDPLSLLFSGGSSRDLERIYRDAASSRVQNALIAEAVRRELAARPGVPLRILEIGGGTGATTQHVLPVLPAEGVDYVFTDVSAFFVAQANATFAQVPGVRAQVFDVETSPAAQGLGGERFDIVIAANVLHATRDLRQTLAHVRALVAPDGLLLLWENTRAQRWVDLVFGLTDGWWRFADADLRPSYPLLTAPEWTALLDAQGMAASVLVRPAAPGQVASPHAIIVARSARGPDAAALVAPGRWLVLSEAGPLGASVAAALAASGCDPTLATERSEHAIATLVRDPAAAAFAGIICLWPLDLRPHEAGTIGASVDAQVSAGMAFARLVNLLAASEASRRAPLWIVTRGAQAVGGHRAVDAAPEQAPFWGWGRSLRFDHPELWGGLVDLDPSIADAGEAAAQLTAAIAIGAREDQLAVRGGRCFAPRMRPIAGLTDAPLRLDPDASYLVTGGLGAVGLRVADWLADRGARHLVLLGRTGVGGAGTEAAHAVRALEDRGVRVRVAAMDASDIDAVRALVAACANDGHAVRGVVHAAGVLEPLPFAALTPDALRAVFRPKIGGAEALHRATRDLPLDFFVLFSTSSSLTGADGLSHYTAANQYLDALAARRRAAGLPAAVVAWGRWNVVSRMMSEDRHRWLDAVGMESFSAGEGLRALESMLVGGLAQAMVLKAAPALRGRLEAVGRGAFLAELPSPQAAGARVGRDAEAPTAAMPDVPSAGLRGSGAGVDPDADLRAYLRACVAETLGMQTSALDVDEPINALGLDSIMALQLKNRVEAECAVKVSVVHFLNGDTVAQVAAVLERERAKAAPVTAPDAASPEPAAVPSELDPLAGRDLSELSDAEVEQLLARFLPNESL